MPVSSPPSFLCSRSSAPGHLPRVMTGPLSDSLASAPVEAEEVTPETAAAINRARASLARGEGIPHEDIRHEFGRVLLRYPVRLGSEQPINQANLVDEK
jgi:hypothetical protein